MRERVTVVTLSVCLSAFLLWRRRRLHLGDDRSVLNVAFFFNRSYFGEKASGTSAVINCSDLLGHRPVIKRFST